MKSFDDSRLSSSYWALRVTFTLVPLLAGLDKLANANLLTQWAHYLSPTFGRVIPLAPVSFMRFVGVVEIVAALLVASSRLTRLGAYVVMAWLICIAINLTSMRVFDVAVRDLAMAVGAFALARLEEVRVGAGERARVAATRTATSASY
jgi:uncharacterized membrane protein YphA (DoxX/SURF4 family)